MELNWLDVIMGVLVIALCIYGYARGFINSFLSVFGLLSAFVCAVLYAQEGSKWIQKMFLLSPTVSIVAAFIVIFVSTKVALVMVGWVLNILTKAPGINRFNQLSGIVFAVFEAFIIFYVLIYVLKRVDSPQINEILQHSWAAKKITTLMPDVITRFLGLFSS